VHVWGNNSQTGGVAKAQKVVKLLDLIKCHSTVSTLAYSHKYRVSPPLYKTHSIVVFGDCERLQVCIHERAL
jgi:hypothetical protein